MKILHLVLYSENEIYKKMYNLTSKYYKNYENIKTIYYTYSDNIIEEYMLEDDILYIKGEEGPGPKITLKTIKAFEYFRDDFNNNKYNFIVRSNISTIINFEIMEKELNKNNNYHYGGSYARKLDWLSPNDGIIDSTYFGTVFIVGIGIILSNDLMKIMLQNKHLIPFNIVDDVAIGIFVSKINSIKGFVFRDENIITNLSKCHAYYYKSFHLGNMKGKYDILLNELQSVKNYCIFYRNRCDAIAFYSKKKEFEERDIDLIQMNYVIETINLN